MCGYCSILYKYSCRLELKTHDHSLGIMTTIQLLLLRRDTSEAEVRERKMTELAAKSLYSWIPPYQPVETLLVQTRVTLFCFLFFGLSLINNADDDEFVCVCVVLYVKTSRPLSFRLRVSPRPARFALQ